MTRCSLCSADRCPDHTMMLALQAEQLQRDRSRDFQNAYCVLCSCNRLLHPHCPGMMQNSELVPQLQEKVEEEPAAPTAALADALDHTIMLAHQAGQLQRDCGLDILPDEFVKSTLKFGLVEVRHLASEQRTSQY